MMIALSRHHHHHPMSTILTPVTDPKAKGDLEALWLGIPDETRSKIEKLPPGIRDSFLELAQSYALSAYILGGIRQRRDCHMALMKVANVVQPNGNLGAFLDLFYDGLGPAQA
jgi:hypothetical protein